jgi:hypothetical protein
LRPKSAGRSGKVARYWCSASVPGISTPSRPPWAARFLRREHAGKVDVRIIDFVDTGHPALLRMWVKRQRGYRAMGYRLSVGKSAAGLGV